MVVRFCLLAGGALIALAWVLMVPFSPAPYQASPGSEADAYRALGLLPKPGHFKISEEVGHEVFEIPAEDEARREMARAAGGGQAMPGMDMREMKQEGEHAEQPMEGMAMGGMKQEDEHAEQPMEGMAMGGMKEAEGTEGAMPGMAMGGAKEGEHAEQPMEGTAMGEAEGGHAGQGLMVLPAKIEIEMREWGFTPNRIMVKPGEVIHFKVRNRGMMPHEFMFMPPEDMAAVNYRLERADWNLTEHEAAYERAVVLPGDSFEVVIRIQQAGTWMFMCMFPYHMRFGMMGMMMTEGAPAMDMGGMKM